MQQPADFEAILTALDAAGVEFVVVGGLALVAHGGPRATVVVNLAYQRSDDNLGRLALALEPFDRGCAARRGSSRSSWTRRHCAAD